MKRREFIALVGRAAAAWPLTARAQQPALPEIGLLNSASPTTFEDRLRTFRDGLKESGYLEGSNLTVVYRWSEGQNDRLSAMASELVARRVAVIAALGEAATYAAKAASALSPLSEAKGTSDQEYDAIGPKSEVVAVQRLGSVRSAALAADKD